MYKENGCGGFPAEVTMRTGIRWLRLLGGGRAISGHLQEAAVSGRGRG